MELSGVFKVNIEDKILEPLKETDLAINGFKERYDLQEWIATYPQILGEELLIIAKEFNFFDGTNERVDLVALDLEGNLVVIELKRDDSGSDVHWQAIKYASYFAQAKGESLAEMLSKYAVDLSYDEAVMRIQTFTQIDDITTLNRKQRIILACHRFAREVTSAVLWLRDGYGVDINCVQLIPLIDPTNQAFYLQAKTIIPIPGTEGFRIDVGSPASNSTSITNQNNRNDDISIFLASIVDSALVHVDEDIRPNKRSRWSGVWGAGTRFFMTWYSHKPWNNYEFSYQLLTKPNNGKRILIVKLHVTIQTAINNGLSDKDLDVLRSAMIPFAEQHKIEMYDLPSTILVEQGFSIPELNDTIKNEASLLLADMISYFTPIVDGLSIAKINDTTS